MDLHIHSVYSDGEWSPKEIIDDAKRKSISIISITDHDAIEGYVQGKDYANELGIKLLPGIELNTDGEDGELHILGYSFDPDHHKLKEHINWRKEERLKWGEKIVKKLNTLGYKIQLSSCVERVGKGVLVRTHIADELVDKGYFLTQREAYDTLLKKGSPGFIRRSPFSASDAISLIKQIGGKSFLAHPGIYKHSYDFESLVKAGLAGIEVYHSKHSWETVNKLESLALKYNLHISGGSDFHGPTSRNPFPIGSIHFNKNLVDTWLKKEMML
ncbi:PHP domain-containing protein [Metabacillus litoralis]|uniref:PHP domain-containing protein n=1 Tax=Metabacillus litoralis TaxID=152268 RepID=UPI00203C64DD|nr:PHP domain-containing protein [Metabacillus litoralis]MCM3162153.1 PHP domain-containing protein [Metabacillus litoralis]